MKDTNNLKSVQDGTGGGGPPGRPTPFNNSNNEERKGVEVNQQPET